MRTQSTDFHLLASSFSDPQTQLWKNSTSQPHANFSPGLWCQYCITDRNAKNTQEMTHYVISISLSTTQEALQMQRDHMCFVSRNLKSDLWAHWGPQNLKLVTKLWPSSFEGQFVIKRLILHMGNQCTKFEVFSFSRFTVVTMPLPGTVCCPQVGT